MHSQIFKLFARPATTRNTDSKAIVCDAVAKCLGCNDVFVQPRYKATRFCSQKCYYTAKTVTENRTCLSCEQAFVFYPGRMSSAARNGDHNAGGYCCSKCRDADKRIHTPPYNTCVECGEVYIGQANSKYCSYACSYKVHSLVPAEQRVCKGCGDTFTAGAGTNRMYYCTPECARRTVRAAKKAHKRSVTVEPFNPISVLERDGWKCYLCGVDTPRILRGTYEPNAPELEHIIALANGGAHTKDNTACACRGCNGLKAANDNFIPQRVAC